MKRPSVKRLFRFSSRPPGEISADASEEVRFHLDMRTDDLRRTGLTEAQARAQAEREFGDVTSGLEKGLRHEHRIERRRRAGHLVSEFGQDVRLGVRLLLRSPGISVAGILTLAVAIGGNTAIFSVANAMLLKPVPVAAVQDLARVRTGQSQMSWPTYQDFLERTDMFSALVAHRQMRVGLATPDGLPARLEGQQTSLNFFSALGVRPALGRPYRTGEPRRDLVVLADHTWRVRFGADASIIGRLLRLNGQPFEVVAVMPPGFRGVAPAGLLTDVWLPVEDPAVQPMLQDRGANRFEVFGRLRPGTTRAQAAAAVRVAAQQIRAEHPELRDDFAAAEVFPVDGIGAFRGMGNFVLPVLAFLALMTIVAGLVLLIGCANIAGLLIGRAAARRREIAVRLALGASRGRLLRQLLTESLVLALMGGLVGVLLAVWLTDGVNSALARLPIPIAFDLRLDGRVLFYALSLSATAAIVFGLAPARRAARLDLVSSLKDVATASVVRQRLRRALVVGQVATCSALLVWSGLFVRSLGAITEIDPGFDPSGVLLARVEFDDLTQEPTVGERAMVELQQRLRQAKEVESIGISTVVPLSLENEEFDVWLDRANGNAPLAQRVLANRVTPGWFDTVRIPLERGRDFSWDDRAGAPDVAIVNETLERLFWNGDAVGQQLRVFQRQVRVVGVARNSKYWTLGETIAPTIYLPFRQHHFRHATVHVRTAHAADVTALVTGEMQRLAPEVFVDFSPMANVLSVAVFPAQVGAAVTGAFGMLAMLLAALGVYGLVAFSVSQRTGEIGVRKAVGARTVDLVGLIVFENLTLTGIGAGAGLGLGTAGANVLRSFIAGVSPMDPLTVAGAALLVMGVALAASAWPALRAARVSPLVVLRDA